MNNLPVIIFFILLVVISLIVIIMVYKKRKTTNETNNILKSQIQQEIKDMEDIANTLKQDQLTASALYGTGLPDIDLKVNERYLTDGIAKPDEVLQWFKTIGLIGASIIIGPDDIVRLSATGFKKMSSKVATSAIGKSMARVLPKLAIKAGVSVATNLAKLTNPVTWALAWIDLTGASWDLSNAGKLNNIMLANEWLEMRDALKSEFDKAVNGKVNILGPLDKLKKEGNFDDEYSLQMLNQAMKVTDAIVNERLGPNASDEQFWAEYATVMSENEDKIKNMTIKAMCEKHGGKYLGKDSCSYKTKGECDSSYKWPIKDYEKDGPYAQWDNGDGGKCVATFNMRELCEEQGSANIGYDYENKTCTIKKPYCQQFGYQFKDKDSDVNNFPNCYKTVGREVLDVFFGSTMTKEIEDLFSQEQNCGNRCGPNQYCYTLTGKGGICLAKSKVGEACPAGMHQSCEGGSECRLSSEGALASAGTVLAAVATGGFLTFPAIAASGGGRSIQSNMGMCTAGEDGVNAPSTSNPGHYIPLGLKGCSAAWKCPTKVKSPNGKTEPYNCHNAFLECQPQRRENETCDVVRSCEKGLWCGGIPIVCRKPGKEGDWCPLDSNACQPGLYCGANSKCNAPSADGKSCLSNAECQSGTCLGGVCAKKIGVTDYLPTGSTCILANTRCEPGSFCNGIGCVPLLDNDSTCVLDNSCKSGSCSRTDNLGVTIGTLGIAGVCANKPGSTSATGPTAAEIIAKRIEYARKITHPWEQYGMTSQEWADNNKKRQDELEFSRDGV
jgi:hypothetical protein